MPPVITVLMPVYNAEKFLKEAIESILNQTFSDFEFLIIDDGSVDNSAKIIRSYSDSRIRYIQNEKNQGISFTLNKGIELASSEYIARMDADDISYPARLEKQYQYFRDNPDCTLVSSWIRGINAAGEAGYVDKLNPAFYFYNLIFTCWIYHPTVMYKREIVKKVGMYRSMYSEDFDLWWRISRNYPFYTLPEVLLDYRATETSLWRETKKMEYSIAEHDLIKRNINYYTNGSLKLDHQDIEFFKHNLQPLVSLKSRHAIIESFKKLDYITDCVK